MMDSRENKKSQIPIRRRGRPLGKDRVPLTIEERRARNACYERERRTAASDAYRELAAAMSVDPNISKAELLANALRVVKTRPEKSLEDFRRQNGSLEWQIQKLQKDLLLLQQHTGEHCEQGETSPQGVQLKALNSDQIDFCWAGSSLRQRNIGDKGYLVCSDNQ